MITSDRTEFDAHLEVLCAGFNVPPTGERKEAYWRGLARMRMHAFIRTVDFALQNAGLEKMPTVPQLWRMHRIQQQQSYPTSVPQKVGTPVTQRDRFELISNLALFSCVVRGGGASRQSLIELLCARRRLVTDFRSIAAEDSSLTEEQMRKHFDATFERLFERRTDEEIEHDMQTFTRTGRVSSLTHEELARISA